MKKFLSFNLIASMLSSSETINPYTGEAQTSKAVWGTAIGAATGAATGALVSKNSGTGALVGGLAGAALGGGVGYYLDVQEAELRQELASTGVSVIRDGDSIRLIMPGNITFKTDSADIFAAECSSSDFISVPVERAFFKFGSFSRNILANTIIPIKKYRMS